jgi:RHS repeat-associated protein
LSFVVRSALAACAAAFAAVSARGRRSVGVRITTGIALAATLFGQLRMTYALAGPGAGPPPAPPASREATAGAPVAPGQGSAATPGAGPGARESATRPDDAVPEFWIPRAATLVDSSAPRGAETLFDGDATTGFTTEKRGSATVRLDLGSVRDVLGVGIHGTGRAKVALYVEDARGNRKLIGKGGEADVKLESDRWALIAPARSIGASVLVVQWTASPAGPASVGELALWVAGRPREALAETAIADRLVTGLPENAVAANALPWTASVARVTATGPVVASFDVKLNLEPLLGRTFLVYEVEKKAHWTGVARSINGHVVRGGYRAETNGLGGVQVEEINPAWLKNGDNFIRFEPTLTEDGRGYSIRNVRIVSVPRGVDQQPAPEERTPLSDGDLATGVGGPGAHTASIAASADREPAFLSFYLGTPARGTLTVAAEGGPARARQNGRVTVDLDGRAAGWQTVPVAGLPKSSALRLRIVGDREGAAQVSEARVQSFPAVATPADLTVSYPLHGECHDHKTYVRGFLAGPVRLPKPQLLVDGQVMTGKIDADGSFEANVEEPVAAKGKPWSFRLDIALEDGGRRTRTVPVDTCVEPPKGRIIGVSPPVEDVGAPYGAVVSPGKASTLEFAGAKIEIPTGAVDSDVRVTMRALDRGQLHPVEAEMDNVTANGGALRFGPHGLRFKRPVKVTLPVDPSRMPSGTTNGDVVTFYFDEASGKWTQLPKVSGRPDRTVGQTTHFTDFIAATVKMPEHPGAQQFNPNTMKDVKVAEPAAGITLIQPPQANSKGSANLGYPIETPPGRNGIGPSLALTYDSDRVNANGWLGVGWDLKLSSIEIDTRFGVPKYDVNDVYMLDGAMLKATTGGTYVKRIEGSFDLIQRSGTGPTDYSWKVTDKGGTVYTYGAAANSRLANPRGGAENGRIFRWYLEKVQDTFGNTMTITYQHDTYSTGTSPNVETFDEVYPSAIDYTSSASLPANYHVTFTLDSAGTRPDMMITARPGFLVSTRRRLTDIKVKSGTTLVRQYRFEYQSNLTDTMQKSVLSAVALWGVEGTASSELYRHTFEYTKAPAATAMFGGQQTWGQVMQAAPPPSSGYVERTADGLSHSVDSLVGGNITLGVGFPYFSASGSYGMDYGSSWTDLAFLGITGQGLPDQIDADGTLSQNNLLFLPQPNNHFSAKGLSGLDLDTGFGGTDRFGWTAGGNISVMQGLYGAGASYARHVQDEFNIVTDLNGDGFPDIAYQSGSSVYGQINDGNRNFTQKQWTGYSLADSPFSTANRMTDPTVAASNFKVDPLIRWTAPFDGSITINSSFEEYGIAASPPGGTTTVELYLPNEAVRSVTVPLNDVTSHTILTNYVKAIHAGEKVFMRVVGADAEPRAAMIAFHLGMRYALPSGWPIPSEEFDPTGQPLFNYDLVWDLRLVGQPVMPWHLTGNGNVGVARCFSKLQTPDEITVSYVLRDKNGGQSNRWDLKTPAVAGTSCFPSTTTFLQSSSDSNMAMVNGNAGVTQDYSLSLEFIADSPIDFGEPKQGVPYAISPVIPANGHLMSYTSYCRNSACGAPSPMGSGYTVPGDLFAANFPIPAADIARDWPAAYRQARVWRTFNNGTTTVAQPMRHVPAPSTSVTFGGTITTTGALTDDVLVLIQGPKKLHAKRLIPKGTASGTGLSVPGPACTVNSDCEQGQTCTGTAPNKQCTGPITLPSNDIVFFTIYSPSLSAAQSVNWSPTMNGTALTASQRLSINLSTRDTVFDNNPPAGVTSRDPMSGGFHNWFYGDWNDSVAPFCDNMTGGCANPIARTTAQPQNNDAVFCSLSPFTANVGAIWYGRGGSDIHTQNGGTVFMIPGRSNSPIATATSATSMSALRVSDTWNLNLTTNAYNATAGLNGGDTTGQVDFFDFNGDRFPDSITRSGVQYNDGVSAFGARQAVDMGIGGDTELRRIQNVSLQAGSTVADSNSRQLMNEAQGDGETKKISTNASLSGSADYGVSSTRIDFADVNGDGLVDHVREEPADGGLRVRLNLGYGFSKELSWARTGTSAWTQSNATVTSGWSDLFRYVADPATVLNQLPTNAKTPASTNVVRLQDTGTSSAAFGVSLGFVGGGGGPTYSVTRTWVDLVDVNGDGLPDQVLKVPGDAHLRVKLNKGDRFAPEQSWSLPAWTTPTGGDYSFLTPDGLAFSTIDGWGKNVNYQVCFWVCFGASGFVSDSKGGPSVQFDDVDGDGDLDQVMKVPGDANVYAKLNKVVNTDEAGGSKLGPTNVLTAVNRPFGGRIDIGYARSGNHVDLANKLNMPSNQWVMSSVVLNADSRTACQPGVAASGCTTETYDYTNWTGYGSGYYDTIERENLGYGSVRTRFPNEDQGTAIQTFYNNDNYYLHGLQTYKYWYQNDTNSVELRSTRDDRWNPNTDPYQLPARTGTFFPTNTASYTYFTETGARANTSLVSRTFDASGNLTDVIDYGDRDSQAAGDDHNYHIDYQTITTPVTQAKATVATGITVRAGQTLGAGTLLAKRTAAFTASQPKPSSVTDVIAGGKHPVSGTARTEAAPANSTWSFTYDTYGNVATTTSPNGSSTTDSDGSARVVTYTYETTTRTYPDTTSWSDGSTNPAFSATAVYDLRFGLPTRIIDVAGAKQEIDYDNYGRITKVFAPNDFNSTGGRIDANAPTIAVTYGHVPHAVGGADSMPEWAMATHRSKVPGEGSLPGDAITAKSLRTVNFIDGLTRTIEVKKDISRDDGSGTSTALMSVSGKTTFDARGRVYQQGQGAYDTPTTYNTFVDVGMVNPTQYAYDVLGRLRQEQHPDNGTMATTNISYQKGTSPKDGREWIVKITSDPKYAEDPQYHYRTEYRTARDAVRLVAERNQINGLPTDLYTSYDYDPLGRVTKVTDAKDNATTASYDTLGNMVSLTSPDAGTREWRYCVGGYVCAEKSPLMANTSNKITYAYDRDRLMSITYPSSGNGAVNYTYGTSNQQGSIADNKGYLANRVTRRTDEAGQFDFNYDSLGNVTSETALLKKQTTTGNYQSYLTEYTWDNFGRLIDVTIPSTVTTMPAVTFPAEKIRYGYDAGGAVTSARGKWTSSPNTTFDYVKHVGYNEFGERVRIMYGNDVFSSYSYAEDTRRLTQASTTVKDIASMPARRTQDLHFTYDLVGNVASRLQDLQWDQVATDLVPVGGFSGQWFAYDPLNQLAHADLQSQGAVTELDRGSVSLTYDEIGNIKQKDQTGSRDVHDSTGAFLYRTESNYSLTPHFIGTAAGIAPHAPSTIDEGHDGNLSTRTLTYDKNGNVTKQVHDVVERRLTWTDTDRVRSICEGTSANCPTIAQSWYTADGTRALHKVTTQNGPGEALYVNQYLTVRNGNLPTKHVFLGDAVVASKVETGATTSNTYWYHSDHLQSTHYVTTSGQVVVQRMEYYPGGEIFREMTNASSIDNIAHARTFTAKELDPSGYYYFGARYYEPQMQMWLSPDPILASYMKRGPAGASAKNLGLYTYVWNNPIVLRDPDGREPADKQFFASGYVWGSPQKGLISTPEINNNIMAGKTTKFANASAIGGQVAAVALAAVPIVGAAWAGVSGWAATNQAAVTLGGGLVVGGVEAAAGTPGATPVGSVAGAVESRVGGAVETAAARGIAGGGRHIALGLERFGLSEVAEKVGAETLLKDPNWKATLLREIANPASRFTVSVEGLAGESVAGKVLSAAQQGIRSGATNTNWELGQLYQAGRLGDVTFVNRSAQVLGNPFK